MKKFLFGKLLFLLFTIIGGQLIAQDYKINFAILDSDELPDSVQVTNLSQNTSLILKGDQILHLVNDWIHIYPNPMQESTTIEFYNPQEDYVSLSIVDFAGRTLAQSVKGLPQGNCVFTKPLSRYLI